MILDIILLAVLIIAFITGCKQGLIKSVWRIAAWIVTIIAVYAALTPVISFLHGTALAENIYGSINEALSGWVPQSEGVNLAELTSLPEWMVAGADTQINEAVSSMNESLENAAAVAAQNITDVIIKIIAAAGLFIIIRLVLSILFRVLDGASKLPVIGGANRLLGGVFSLISVTVGVYLVLALISLFANPSVYGYINESTAVKYLFNNNILMKLFM